MVSCGELEAAVGLLQGLVRVCRLSCRMLENQEVFKKRQSVVLLLLIIKVVTGLQNCTPLLFGVSEARTRKLEVIGCIHPIIMSFRSFSASASVAEGWTEPVAASKATGKGVGSAGRQMYTTLPGPAVRAAPRPQGKTRCLLREMQGMRRSSPGGREGYTGDRGDDGAEDGMWWNPGDPPSACIKRSEASLIQSGQNQKRRLLLDS